MAAFAMPDIAAEPLGAFMLNTEKTARVRRSRPTPLRMVSIMGTSMFSSVFRLACYGQIISMEFQEVSNRFDIFLRKNIFWRICIKQVLLFVAI